ncbi:hypothetical protein [Spirosoma arcticum]
MKHVISIVSLCLLTLSGFSQPVKYSFEEVSYSPRDKGVGLCLYSEGIENSSGSSKYYVTGYVDLKSKTIKNVVLIESGVGGGQPKSINLDKITHVSHLYLGTPNTGGVEAYACRGTGTTMVFYFLVGATTSDTLKFLYYQPSGPNGLQVAN